VTSSGSIVAINCSWQFKASLRGGGPIKSDLVKLADQPNLHNLPDHILWNVDDLVNQRPAWKIAFADNQNRFSAKDDGGTTQRFRSRGVLVAACCSRPRRR
jgi:hypothetical protein